jgi:hypothetical protein
LNELSDRPVKSSILSNNKKKSLIENTDSLCKIETPDKNCNQKAAARVTRKDSGGGAFNSSANRNINKFFARRKTRSTSPRSEPKPKQLDGKDFET